MQSVVVLAHAVFPSTEALNLPRKQLEAL